MKANLQEASTVLNKSPTTLRAWIRQGCPASKNGSEWSINIPSVVEWLERRAVSNAVGDVTGVTEEELKRRKLAAETTIAEIEAAKAKSEVIPTEDVERASKELSIELSSRMMLVGKRSFPNDLERRSLVDDEVRQVLSDAVDIDLDYE